MSKLEFLSYYFPNGLPFGSFVYAERLFREFNTERAGSPGSLSFAHWATGVFRWCAVR
jgi:hypothetical protein